MKESLSKPRTILNIELEKFKEISYLVTSLLLIVRFANDFTPFDNNILSIGLMVLISIAAGNIYTKVLKMHNHNREARLLFNKYNVYAINPIQRMYLLNQTIPILEALAVNSPNKEYKNTLNGQISLLKRWAIEGEIPEKDFPYYLKNYYTK